MIGVGLGVDDEPDRHRCEVPDGRPDVASLVGVLSGVDDDDTILGKNDPGVRLETSSGVDVDAVGELLDLRTEILSACSADERTPGEHRHRASAYCSHLLPPI